MLFDRLASVLCIDFGEMLVCSAQVVVTCSAKLLPYRDCYDMNLDILSKLADINLTKFLPCDLLFETSFGHELFAMTSLGSGCFGYSVWCFCVQQTNLK